MPCRVAWIENSPAEGSGVVKAPEISDVTTSGWLVALDRNSTLANGIASPFSSATLPVTLTSAAAITAKQATRTGTLRVERSASSIVLRQDVTILQDDTEV